jgi:hypothetical protein
VKGKGHDYSTIIIIAALAVTVACNTGAKGVQ